MSDDTDDLPEFDLGDDYVDVHENGTHLQAVLKLPNGATLHAQFVADKWDSTSFYSSSNLRELLETRANHEAAWQDMAEDADLVKVKGKPYRYTLTCWSKTPTSLLHTTPIDIATR